MRLFYGILAAAAVITGALGSATAASATPVPALFGNPVMCSPATLHESPSCGLVIEPKLWYWTGDGSAGLKNLHWAQWGAQRAAGTGTIVLRTGDWQAPPLYGWHTYPVNVLALYPVEDQGRYVFGIVYAWAVHTRDDAAVGYQTVPDLI